MPKLNWYLHAVGAHVELVPPRSWYPRGVGTFTHMVPTGGLSSHVANVERYLTDKPLLKLVQPLGPSFKLACPSPSISPTANYQSRDEPATSNVWLLDMD